MIAIRTALALLAALALVEAQALPVVEKTLPMGNTTAGIQSDPSLGQIYVTNFDDGSATVVDIPTLTVLQNPVIGGSPRRLIADAARHFVYVGMATAPGYMFWGDASGNSHPGNGLVKVGNSPRSIGSNLFLGRIYLNNVDDGTVSVVDTVTKTVIATITVGGSPGTPVSNSLLKKVYVPNGDDGTVSVIDEVALKVVKTVTVGKLPQYAAVDAQHAKVYVNNVTDNTVSVIDSNTDTVIKTIATGVQTTANFGHINAVYRRYYIANATDGTVTIINTDTDTVTNTVKVGTNPREVIADGVGGDVYVTNQGSNSVSVINANSETVLGTFATSPGPWRMLDALGHLFVLCFNGASPDLMTVATENNSIKGTAIATEFYHKDFNHYFHTADEVETRLLVDGLFHDDWHRTFGYFRVWTAPAAGRFPVSRFFSTQWGDKSSHFFTANKDERDKLVAGTIPGWQLEADAVYYIGLADASGACPAGQAPLYRLYNNGMGGAPNHRITGDKATRDALVALGWIPEGSGPDVVYGCVPTLRAG